MKSNRSMLYTLGFVFMIAFVVIYAAKKTTLLNSNPANTANSDNLTETAVSETPSATPETDTTNKPTSNSENTNANTSETPISNQAYSPNEPSKSGAQATNSGRPDSSPEAARIQQIEIEKTKELNLKNVKMIQEQMKKEEITSLQSSIVNDEKLLKEIEAQGTGADDYRYIESNLKKRRARLKELTEK